MAYEECEEPRCVRPSVRQYKGRNLCQDCYDKYREQEDKQRMDLPDY
jgi:hypothetical protein